MEGSGSDGDVMVDVVPHAGFESSTSPVVPSRAPSTLAETTMTWNEIQTQTVPSLGEPGDLYLPGKFQHSIIRQSYPSTSSLQSAK